MTLPNGVFKLDQFMAGLAENMSQHQLRLDEEYEKSLRAFLPVYELARALGYEELARQIAPARLLMESATVQLDFSFARQRGREFSLKVRMLNLGYARKYAYAQTIKNSLSLTVQRVEPPPNGK